MKQHSKMCKLFLSGMLLACWHAWVFAAAWVDPSTLQRLAGDSSNDRLQAIQALGQSDMPGAANLLAALGEGKVRLSGDGRVLVLLEGSAAIDATSGDKVSLSGNEQPFMLNNRLRRAIQLAQATVALFAPESSVRLNAAIRMQKEVDPAHIPVMERALQREKDDRVKSAMQIALAGMQLKSTDPEVRLAAVKTLGASGIGAYQPALNALLEKNQAGQPTEPDARVRHAALSAIHQIDRHQALLSWAGNIFFGISLGSVLLLAALGLAITFGLMGVINMAHGELLMIGAYATYMVQALFKSWFPASMNWYVIAALPVAFIVTALVGMALERTVIRWLYGRPLETLLATWGISLILMQAVRSIFGAQNVEVANPSWMSGGWTVMGGLVLSYNRIAIIIFSMLVVLMVWLMLNYTRLGLFVRAITQNRRMADCVGVPTGKVDMLAFGLGAGIAGLGGVALSQLGNVGPDLGRSYIVDSFMVVVLGGVGQLAGTVVAALGLGAINKIIEPFWGAVIAKIAILFFIVLFVQKRPQGLFAPKGRSAE